MTMTFTNNQNKTMVDELELGAVRFEESFMHNENLIIPVQQDFFKDVTTSRNDKGYIIVNTFAEEFKPELFVVQEGKTINDEDIICYAVDFDAEAEKVFQWCLISSLSEKAC